MEQTSLNCMSQEEADFNIREWDLKACIGKENTKLRRHSASNIRSFREESRSFGSKTAIHSTASSPAGYIIRDVIDPSTYCFTTALRALQARSKYDLEWISPDGLALNSKWHEAEKYICNPLSGEVPMECLSTKTLSGRSIPTIKRRFTMSGPLVYSSHTQLIQTKTTIKQKDKIDSPIQDKKVDNFTRDAGTQITLHNLSSRSPSPVSTLSIHEISLKGQELEDGVQSSNSATKFMFQEEIEREEKREEEKVMCKCRQMVCLPWKNLWMRQRQRKESKIGIVCHVGENE